MRHRNAVLIPSLLVLVSGCGFMGESTVRVDTGNQQIGYLSRPLQFTFSSDESVQQVAQRICDNVKAGSYAKITFVGKVPGPGPFDLADWGRYRYDCEGPAIATPRVPTVTANPAPAIAAPPAPAVTANPVPAIATPAVPVVTANQETPVPASGPSVDPEKDEQHGRDCQRQKGTYQICLGSCVLNSTSPAGVIAGECQQRCAPQMPAGCN